MKRGFFVKAEDLVQSKKKNGKVTFLPVKAIIKEVIDGVKEEDLSAVIVMCATDNEALNNTAANIVANTLTVNELNATTLILKTGNFGENQLVLSQQSGGIVFKRPAGNDILISTSTFLPSSDNSAFEALGFKIPEVEKIII